jgi:mannopine transport system substrate-binding protein
MRSKVSMAASAAAVNGFAAFSSAAPCREFVVATTGGVFEEQMRHCFFAPFTAMTGIEVRTVSGSDADNFARVREMVAHGDITIDLYQSTDIQASSAVHASVNEDVSGFAADYAGDADFLPRAFQPKGILSGYGTSLIAYDAEAFGSRPPADWTDFWDVKRYPGSRALPDFDDPWRVIAAALLADGVAPEKLWPLDLDRAFRKLDEIRPHVALWWRMGEETVSGFTQRNYAMGLIWQSRAMALRRCGQPLGFTHNQAFLVADRWALVKGSPNRDHALWFLEFFLGNVGGQARRCELAACTPVRHSATRRVSEAVRAVLPTNDAVMSKLVIPDAAWINANSPRLLERWRAWRSQAG